MRKWTRFLFVPFILFGISIPSALRAEQINKTFCDRVVGRQENAIYCNALYKTLFEWYDKNNIETRFQAAEGLRYEKGVWVYVNWPLQILFTDTVFKGALKNSSYESVVQLQDLFKIDSDRDLIPNVVQQINDYAVAAIQREVSELGFRHPAREKSKFIVIKIEDGGWQESSLPSGALGRAWVNEQGFPVISINPYLGSATLEKTIAHELFHLIQFSYNPDFISHAIELNFSEGTALWMERLLFEFDRYLYDKDYLQFFKSYYASPERSLFGTHPADKNFQYGTVLWPIFLEKQFKKSIIREIWEAYFSEVKRTGNYNHSLYFATDAALKKRGSSLKKTYRDFARWIFDKNQYRRDAAAFPNVKYLAEVKDYPTPWLEPADDLANPSLLGSSFIAFDTRNQTGDFYLRFKGAAAAEWALDFYAVGTKNVHLSQFSKSVPLGVSKIQSIRIPKKYLKSKLVLIASPVYAKQLKTSDNAFNFFFPFRFRAEFKSLAPQKR